MLLKIVNFASGQRAVDTEISCGEDLQNPQGLKCGSVRAGAATFAYAVDEFPGRPRPGIVICNDRFYGLPTLDENFDMIMKMPASHDLWHKIGGGGLGRQCCCMSWRIWTLLRG